VWLKILGWNQKNQTVLLKEQKTRGEHNGKTRVIRKHTR